MHLASIRICVVTVFAGLVAVAAGNALAQEPLEQPTLAEVRRIEAKVKMPRGAGRRSGYVRYYYAVARSERRMIEAIYVAKFYLKPTEIPAGDISIVVTAAEIPAPEDGGCSVVFVTYDPAETSKVAAECGSDVVQ